VASSSATVGAKRSNVSRKGRPLHEGEHDWGSEIVCGRCKTEHVVYVSRRAYPGHETHPTEVRCVQCLEVFTTEHVPEGGGVEAWRKGTQPISAKGRQRVIDAIAVALLLLTVVWFWARCAR
jgi:hypothetical protein